MSVSLVSVIVPAYQAERFLEDALDSALAQDHPAVEVIVVDDGSTDRTSEIAARRPVRLLSRPHRGVAAARNAGLAAARGDFVAILDSDDLWPPDRLSSQLAFLREHPECGIVLGLTEVFLHPGEQWPRSLPHLTDGEAIPTVPGSMLARREAFRVVGGFDESLRLCEDLDWLARAKDAGIPAGAMEKVVLRYRMHGANTTLDTRGIRAGVLRILRQSVNRQRGVSHG